nr:retrovirus-related Pol polyprotein from transposon 17.6 [Tanacetum cinerariifolium]
MQKWLMPVACHMFTYTLKDSARIWWNSQKASSILNYEDLKAKFRSDFSQQKRFTKTHLAVHSIKQEKAKVSELLPLVLPSTYKGLMEKTYTWIEAREVATNGGPNDHKDNFERKSCNPRKRYAEEDYNKVEEITFPGYHQILIAKKDEMKTDFYTREGGFCYKRLPFRLKNARETYQRLIDKVFSCQVGRNMEVNADEMVIKSDSKEEMLADIKERLMSVNLEGKEYTYALRFSTSSKSSKRAIQSKATSHKAVPGKGKRAASKKATSQGPIIQANRWNDVSKIMLVTMVKVCGKSTSQGHHPRGTPRTMWNPLEITIGSIKDHKAGILLAIDA